MKKIETKNNRAKLNLYVKIIFCFIFVLTIGILKENNVFAANETGKLYLSDISYMEDKTFLSGGHMIKTDKNDSDKLITLKVDDQPKVFVKGVTAWATSEVVYNLNGYNYDYFTSYIGVDLSEQSDYFNTGVKFSVYTSNDAEHWEQKFASNTVFYGWTNAEFIKVPLDGAKYLKLVANNNSPNWWAEWYDEAIYADAKLIKDGYVENNTDEKVDFIKTVDEYDNEIKNYVAEGKQGTDEYELALLQREFVKNFDYDILVSFVNCEEEYKETVKWLMTDLNNIRLYILGGEPDGNYISSMQALTSLYKAHKDDLDIKETTDHGTVKGELYKKMMITLSLTHSAQVALWMDTTSPENQSTAVGRYEIFKQLHDEGKFVVSDRQDHTPWFEDLKVEEMRYVLNNIIDDEEILWLNEYTQYFIDQNPKKEEEYLQPHHYMKYITPDYSKPEFHDPSKESYWDEKYRQPFSKYNITYRPGVYKLWMNIEGGAVCGGISKIGSNIRGVHGTPSSVISQPGHAALIYYRKDANGNGYWTIDNDVSGWAQSGKTEKLSVRMPLGWGSDEYVEGWAASYIVLAQEALNHYSDYEKSTELILLANSYEGDKAEQERLYREALKVQPYNIDAWYGIIRLYKADETKTADDYYNLAEEMGEELKYFPLPMYNLTNLLKDKMTDNKYDFKFTILQTRLLTEGSTLDDKCTKVYQPSIARTVAKFLLGQMDKDLATFSFDGEDAGKIVLSSRYDESGIRWDYTLNGKDTAPDDWVKVNYSAEEEHKLTLSKDEIESITSENDIYVHVVGLDYSEENLFKIDITEQQLSSNLYANDLENRIVGIDPIATEWRYVQNSEIATVSTIGNEWTSFEAETPNLKGDVSIEVRQEATGTQLMSKATRFDFTSEGESDLERRYVPVSHLSIHEVSSEAPAQGRYAKNAIDGNYNTAYHSNWSGGDTERYMIIKVDRPIYVSGIEYVPAGGGNGRILDVTISVSATGEDDDWNTIYQDTNLSYVDTNKANDDDFGLKNIKKFDTDLSEEELKEIGKVQYIKIKADKATNGNWFTARMFNIFENVKLDPHPTAGIDFSTVNPTTQNVVAKITNFSTDTVEMIIDKDEIEKVSEIAEISEDGMTAIFKENGTYTFKFKNTETEHIGTAIANVDWIDRTAPTATIKYSTTNVTEGEVVAELIPSENIKVTNNPHNEFNEEGKLYTFTKNGEFEFQFQDEAGNTGTALAKVTWIKSKTSSPDGWLQGDPGVEEPGTGDQDPSEGGNQGEEEQNPGGGEDSGEEEKDPSEGKTPGEEEQEPGEGKTPGEGDQDPSEGENPGTEEQDPNEGENPDEEEKDPGKGETPEAGDKDPTEGKTPDEGDQKPSEGETPEAGEQNPSGGENSETDNSQEGEAKTEENTKVEQKTQASQKNENTPNDTLSKQRLPYTGKSIKGSLIAVTILVVALTVFLYTKFIKIGKSKGRHNK